MSTKIINGKQQAQEAPVIPHITANIIPLATILKNYSEEAYKELTQLLSTLQSSSTSDLEKKKSLLLLLVKLRENFIRLYVLNKWSVNSVQFGRLIDLLNWLRTTIEQISLHSIWGLRNLNSSLTSAKLPNPDLITSLEVLLKGRPQLPSYSFLPKSHLSPQTILKTLQKLNISLALRLSLLDELPLAFYQYTIKDGRVRFTVERSFQCCLSIADDVDDYSQFFLIDFKFNFSFKDNSIIYDEETSLSKTHHKLENVTNQVLLANRLNKSGGLLELYKLLSAYTLNYKLFLIHRQLISIRVGYWKSQISHTYSADKNLILIYYWLKLQPNKKKSSTSSSSYIEISLTSNDTMQLKWAKDNEVCETVENFDLETDELSIESILTSITERHVNIKIMQIYESLMAISPLSIQLKPSSPSSPALSLILQLTPTKNVTLSISPLSGLLYFTNPTPLLSSLLPSLNATLADRFQRLPYEILSIILKTNIEVLNSLMESTEWLLNKIRISDYSKIVGTDLDDDLVSLQYYRRHDWPQGWFLISSLRVDSTSSPVHIEWFVAKIKLHLGTWSIAWSEELKPRNSNEGLYQTLKDLAIHARSKLLSQLITEDLKNDNAKLQLVDQSLDLPFTDKSDENAPIMLIKNSSIFKISNCHENLFVQVVLNNLNSLKISIVGRLKNFKINELHDTVVKDVETTTLDYSPATNIFEVKSIIDGSVSSSTTGEAITVASIINSSSSSASSQQKTSLLTSSIELLHRFSQMLSILGLLSKESLTIVSNNLSLIEFQYDNEYASLDITDSEVQIRFDDKNPHQLLSLQISNFLSDHGLSKTLRLMKFTYPIIKKLAELNSDHFTLIIHELNFFKLLYLNFLIFIRIEFNKRIVLIKYESLKKSIPLDVKVLKFIQNDFNERKKFSDNNLVVFDLEDFDVVIKKITTFFLEQFPDHNK